MTSSGASGPPKPSRSTASYGSSGQVLRAEVGSGRRCVRVWCHVSAIGGERGSGSGSRARRWRARVRSGWERSGVGALRSRRTASIRRAKTRPAAAQSTQSWSDAQLGRDDDDDGPEHRRHGIQLAAQHLGHLAREQVAHHAATDGGDDPDEDGRDRATPRAWSRP